jgi:hypothetical protein
MGKKLEKKNIGTYYMLHLCICHVKISIKLIGKGKGKFHPRTGHENAEGE